MSITDELRKYAEDWGWLDISSKESQDRIEAIADRIDAEHERAVMSAMNDALYHANDESMAELGWIRLPKDTNGEYIRVGDVLDGYGKTIEVVELRIGRSGWVLISRDGNGYADTFAFTHHTSTVEDVLSEFFEEVGDGLHTLEAVDTQVIIAKYAAKLRLAGDAE